jgi:hypothetical protein
MRSRHFFPLVLLALILWGGAGRMARAMLTGATLLCKLMASLFFLPLVAKMNVLVVVALD